jgi:integrase
VISALEQGRDLAAEKREKFAMPTLGELSTAYAQHLKAVGRRHPNYLHKTVLLTYSDWLNRRINTITQREVSERHDHVALNRGVAAASRGVKALRTLFNHAEIDLALEVKNVARPVRVQDSKIRSRYLSPTEERKLLTVITAEPLYVQDYIKLLLLTGARRDNVAGMRWCDICWQTNTWTIPAAFAKAGNDITIPLLPEAISLLRERQRTCGSSVYAFPSRGASGRLVAVWIMLQRLKARAILFDLGLDWHVEKPREVVAALPPKEISGKGIGNITIHDLRRTVAVKLVSSGASLPVIAAALGHKNLKTTQQVYALATQPDVRKAMERMALHTGSPQGQ